MVGQGVIAGGWDGELDEQRQLARGGKELLASIERSERERTGITSLKVRFNKVFGYYIEISKANLDRVPDHYERRQTLTNAERFVTPELKELEAKILVRRGALLGPRARLCTTSSTSELRAHAQRIATTRGAVARLDVARVVRRARAEVELLPAGHGGVARTRHPRRPPPGARGAPALPAVHPQRL